MKLDQYRTIEAALFDGLKNIFTAFLSAKLILDGYMTLGVMYQLSIF